MTANRTATIALLAGLSPLPGLAQDSLLLEEITATAGLVPVEISRTGATVETLNGDELNSGGQGVADTLDRLPGVSLTSNGGLGTTSSLRLRGLGGSYIGVRIDGIDVTDPSSTQTAFDFGPFARGLPGRVEVLKGSQSALYGSESIAGVVDITTWRPEKLGFSGGLQVEGGSDATYSGTLNLGQLGERGEIALTLSHVATDGFSARSSDTEADGFEQTSLSLFAAYDVTENLRLGFSALYAEGVSNFDRSTIDPSGDYDTEQTGARLFAQFATGAVEHEFALSSYEIDRVDATAPAFYTRNFLGERRSAEYLGNAELRPGLTLAFGADWTEEKARLDALNFSAESSAAFGELQYAASDALDLSVSLRYDDHSDFDDQLSGRGAMAWRLQDDLILRAVIGTGYRAPSLYERFNPSFGNPALSPEKSRSAELGIEKRYGGDSHAKVTLFHTEIDDLIDYDFTTFTYNQVPGTTRSQGVEISGLWEVNDRLSLLGNYTYTDAEGPNGTLIRVPRHDLNIGVEAGLSDRLTGVLSARFAADLTDYTVYPATGPLDDFTVVDASLSYALQNGAEAYFRIENLFDEQYETVRGYNSPDRSIFAGIRATF
ncbi:vitamin B12 transporter [Rhodovulum bhavnagarense]|uniref:Vitamin B12 transporter n=1 Tax=Rhodovulum bhavnagarense TaxID=992286 RepID=A0A4R2RG93_9RHOB|nr:TonB-dependent receptor [Rhodovulum bhavnagarense]TCP61953.1 vitamin B12 transporter [Rhodovulum bhavnagarense]